MGTLLATWMIQSGIALAYGTAIGLSFLAIAACLITLVYKTRIPFSRLLIAFSACLISCGSVFLLEAWAPTTWWLWGLKFGAASTSALAATSLIPLLPRVVKAVQTLYLSETRRRLLEDYSDELKAVNAEMERRVELRTKELSDSQLRFQELVNTIDGIVWEADVGKPGFSFVSSQAERITGHSILRWQEEDRFWQRILHAEDLAKITGDRYVQPARKKDLQSEYRIVTADNRILWMRDHIKVIFEEGRPTKMRGIMVDVTEQKIAEQALQREKEVSQRAAKVKSEFLANMSHEIRTPLNAIIGMSSLALECRVDREARECLSTVKTAADSLLTLVNDILDFSKIEAGGVKLEISDFRLGSLLRNAKEVVQPLANEKEIRLTSQADSALALRGDPGRLLQVLLNLLSNAVKFTPKGGEIAVLVDARSELHGRHALRFEVRDNGIGIDEEAQKRLFVPFQQADSSTARKFGGTGLGLSICKRLVELMGGRIGVRSAPGRGSVFWLELSMLPAENATFDSLEEEDTRLITRPAAYRVLVADDNPANQKVIQRLLEKLGHAPEVVTNGIEVVEAHRSGRFDIVLMDCQMPEMDGYEATRRIREFERSKPAHQKTPVIALTAHALAGDREKCQEAGMDGYLSKPVSIRELALALEKFGARTGAPPEAPLDENYLAKLEGLNAPGKPDIIRELIAYFLDAAPAKVSQIRAALEAGNGEQLRVEAHSFKSTCFNVGAQRLAMVCQQLEELGERGDGRTMAAEAPLLSKRLEQEWKIATEELGQLLSRREAA